MGPHVQYQERTGWSLWVHCAVGLTFIAAAIPIFEFLRGNVGDGQGQMSVGIAVLLFVIGLGLPGSIYAFMGELRTRVTEEGLELSWGYLGVIKKTIPFSDVESAEAVTYSPLGEFGGWGIRFGGNKKTAWTVKGNRALVLERKDGTRFYLGSERPERILPWVTSAMKRSDG